MRKISSRMAKQSLKLLEYFQIARRLRVFNLKSIYTFDCSWLREIVELHGTFHKIPRSTSNWYFLILHPRFSLNVCFWQYLWKQKTWGGEVKNYQNFHFPFDRRSNECLLLLLFTHSWSPQSLFRSQANKFHTEKFQFTSFPEMSVGCCGVTSNSRTKMWWKA